MGARRAKPMVSLRKPKPDRRKKREVRLSLKSVVRYANKTFHLYDAIRSLPDSKRANHCIELEDAVCSSFMMMLMGFSSMNSFFNALQSMLERILRNCGLSSALCRIPRRDQAERILATVDSQQFKDMMWEQARTAHRNGIFKKNQIGGKTVLLLDGTVIMTTFKKGKSRSEVEKKKKAKDPSAEVKEEEICPYCQEAHYDNDRTSCSHRVVVGGIPHIGDTGFMAINYEMLKGGDVKKKSEGELTGAKHLLKEVGEHLPGVVDIVLADALYANKNFLEAVKAMGAEAVVRIKGDNRTVIKEAEEQKGSSLPGILMMPKCQAGRNP